MSASESRADIEDMHVEDVWKRLEEDPQAVLIDVRTRAEWAFVGMPDLSRLGKGVVAVEWQSFPTGQVNAVFVDQLEAELAALSVERDTTLFFICRSGSRSRHAAQAMAAAGYRRCINVADGFEGPHDGARHRGSVGGWKVAGLPWIQG